MSTTTRDVRRKWMMSPREFADYVGVPRQTVYQWRVKGYGPPSVTVGRHVRYDQTDVDAWLDGLKESN